MRARDDHTEARLRALAGRLISAQDQGAERLAHDIHDGLGQTLAALKLDLAWVSARAADGDPAVAAKLRHMTGMVDDLFAAIRRMAARVHPRLLTDLGLAAALEDLVADFAARGGAACALDLHPAELALPPASALALYRIAQEGLDNVSRHAGAHRVALSLRKDGDLAVLAITDDGRGITDDERVRPSSIGIAAMRERILLVGGTLALTGAPGGGTTVVACVRLA